MSDSLGDYCRVPGSYRRSSHLPGSSTVNEINPEEHKELIISIRPPNLDELQSRVYEMNKVLPLKRRYLTLHELESMHAPSSDQLGLIEEFASSRGLAIVKTDILKRAVILGGTVKSVSSAFHTKLKRYVYRGSTYLGRKGWIYVPRNMVPIIQGVHGLDTRPQFRPSICAKSEEDAKFNVSRRPFSPLEICKLYNFPTIDAKGMKLDGSNQSIAIIELGGGFHRDEIRTYFEKLGIGTPNISCVSIGDGKNNPNVDQDADGEVTIDISIAGLIAPKAKLVVYFSDPSTKGFFNAVNEAIHDKQYNHSIVCISWGSAEGSGWGQWMRAIDQSFLDAAAMGKTIICASGDHGSSDLRPDDKGMIDNNLSHVEFPASSPFALGCGGTKVTNSNTSDNNSEIAWNEGKEGATGGGISKFFKRPPYQVGIRIPKLSYNKEIDGRGVPDVCGMASPGYDIPVHGITDPRGRGGTSAVVPMWAGLIALINQSLGKPVGLINSLLYEHPAFGGVLSDITRGNNGLKNIKVVRKGKRHVRGYKAHKGWDACTGLGSPNGQKLLNALTG